MNVSVVASMYQSASYLREFHQRVTAAVAQMTGNYEIVLVNDGSPDDSLDIARQLVAEDPHVRVVDLSRNFGHHRAMMTGLAHARKDLVFLLDCDLEEPPELILRFHQEMTSTAADVVYGVQQARKGSWLERAGGELFYWAYNALSTDPIPRNLTTARLMTRRYVDALMLHREREVTISGLWAITGFKQVPSVISKSSKGKSTYTFARRLNHVVQSLTSFSNKPLLYVFHLGWIIVVVAAAAAAYLIFRRLFLGIYLEGWPSVIVSIWLLGGMTIFCLGIIGIYLSKIFTETKQRPYTIVRELFERRPGE